MKIETNVRTLRDALSVVTMALSARTTLPAYEGVFINAYGDSIELTGSDGTMTVVMQIDGEILSGGSGVIRGKVLSEIVKKMPSGQITVDVDAKNRFTLRVGEVKYGIDGMGADTYPQRNTDEVCDSFEIPESMLHELIAKTESCIAGDDARPVLNGGCIEVMDGRISMTALDGFRMSTHSFPCPYTDKRIQAIVPKSALAMLKKLCNPKSDEQITISLTETALLADFGNAQVQASLISGEYVNWRRLIPVEYATQATIKTDVLRDAIDRATIVSRMGGSKLIKLSFTDNVLAVGARSIGDEVTERIEIEKSGPDLDISFNSMYLSDMSRAFDSEEITLNLNSGTSACIVKPVEDSEYLWLVLPVRTSA